MNIGQQGTLRLLIRLKSSSQKNMVVTFNIMGIAGNLKPTAATSHIAGLEFADESWAVNHWSSLSGDKYDATIHGDGTYKVWMETTSNAAGAKVFCIDIKKSCDRFD